MVVDYFVSRQLVIYLAILSLELEKIIIIEASYHSLCKSYNIELYPSDIAFEIYKTSIHKLTHKI